MLHQFLFLPPLLCMFVATWRIWEPERDPRFGWMLAAVGLQLLYLTDQLLVGAPWPSVLFGGVLGAAALLFCLCKTVKAEQISERIRRLRD